MKKRSALLILLFFVSLVFCSCVTVVQQPTEFTEEEAQKAMYIALCTSVENTNKRFFQKMGNNDFFPSFYSELTNKKSNIPGMKTIIASWNEYFGSYLLQNKELIENETNGFVQNLTIENAKMLVEKSDTSGTELLEQTGKQQFFDMLYGIIENADFSILYNAVNQYNAWVTSENFRNKTNMPKIEYTDSVEYLVNLVYETYKNTLTTFEELFRTTPDPYVDDICKLVFGIN